MESTVQPRLCNEAAMIWMAVIMSLPLLGVELFFFYPWQLALPVYLILVAVSAFFDVLMMRSMRLPVRTGREEMVGSTAAVLNWKGDSGQVMWNGEIWQARGKGSFRDGQTVKIDGLSRLTVHVKSVTDL